MLSLKFLPYRRVTVRRDPDTGEVISVDFILYKLPPAFLVDVDAPGLAVMDLAAHHCGVGVRLHLEACYTVSMDVTVLKVTLKNEGQKSTPPIQSHLKT